MKVYISKYRDHWYSPYTLFDYMFFWTDWSKCSRWKLTETLEDQRRKESRYVERPEWTEKWAERLTPISKGIQWFLDKVHPKVEYVKIDYWDTWNMDRTLALVTLPMLKQLRSNRMGSAYVDLDDVPEELRFTTTEDFSSQKTFDFYHESEVESFSYVEKRWDYVLDEMIFAFEHLVDDKWEDAFRSGEIDFKFVPCPDNPKISTMEDGPNHTYVCDYDGIQKVYDRIDNGLRLFGKYFRHLWD